MFMRTYLRPLVMLVLMILLALVGITACGSGGGGGGGGGGGSTGQTGDYFIIGSTALYEAAVDGEMGYDPYVVAFHKPADLPPWTDLGVASFGTGPAQTEVIVALAVYTPDGGSSSEGTYSLSGDSIVGSALFEVDAMDYWCVSTDGTATITADGGVGSRIVGTFSVATWLPLSGTCPAAPSGSFSITREPDNLFGNDGTQADEFTVGATTYTENATTLYDPLASLVVYPNYSNPTLGDLYMHLNRGGSLSTGEYSDSIDFSVNDVAVALPTGTWDNATSGVSMYLTLGGNYCILSSAAGNTTTVTFTTAGGIGTKIIGSYDFQSVTGTGCPSTVSGIFSVTRESDQ